MDEKVMFLLILAVFELFSENNAQKGAVYKKSASGSMVTLVNAISRDDLGHYKFFSWHYPTVFTVTINGIPIASGAKIQVPAGLVEVVYSYEWEHLWFKREGKKRAAFKTGPVTETPYTLIFDGWDKKNRLILLGAVREADEEVLYTNGQEMAI